MSKQITTHPLKVAQCLAGAEYGGAENFYTRLVCSLAAEPTIEQRAFTRDNAQRVPALNAAGVTVEHSRFGSPVDLLGHYRYRQALKKFSPDVVVTYMSRASKLTPRGDYKLVCRLGHYYNLKYYRHADHWVGISKGICQHIIDGGLPADRVHYIPNFADETIVPAIARDSFNTPLDQPLLLAAGRLHVNKGFDVLIKALKKIPQGILWLAGDGPEKDALQTLCQDEGVADRVRFLGWRNDVASLMRTADMFICPSRHEGLGSIVMESWFNECPIIATASQGPGELIEQGKTGLLSPVDDVEQLTDNIIALLKDKHLKGSLVTSAKAHYNHYFSRQVISQQYVDLFREITSE